MAYGRCGKCSKGALIVFNVLFFIMGMTTLGFGLYITLEKTKLDDYFRVIELNHNNGWSDMGLISIVSGAIVAVLGFTGLYGAIREEKCCLTFFAAVISVILILELALGAVIIVRRNDINSEVEQGMYKSLLKYQNNTKVKESWDLVQKENKCCGVVNGTDWDKISSGFLPRSCFGEVAKEPFLYPLGCLDKVNDEVEGNFLVYGIAFFAFAVLQLFGLLWVVCLVRDIAENTF